MKVCTDACLFGAWSANKFLSYRPNAKNILDIGTGTGLLTLMLAQKIDANFFAVEMDQPSSSQALQNFKASPWRDKILLQTINILNLESEIKFECIICNPPFYENDLASPHQNKNAAMHSSELNFSQLLNAMHKHLEVHGVASVLVPFAREAHFEARVLQSGFYLSEKMQVRQTPQHPFFRSMYLLSLTRLKDVKSAMEIKSTANDYSIEFRALLKNYYLAF